MNNLSLAGIPQTSMMNSGPSGFHNATFSKAILLLTGTLSVGASILKLQHLLEFADLTSVFSKYQVWRLVTNHFFFGSPGELLFGLLLIYYFRLFERQMGTTKFAGFTFVSLVVATLTQVALYVAVPTTKLSSGPYSFLFSCFVLFFSDVPATHRYRLCGIPASDKLFIYTLALQLLISNSPSSVFSGICGIIGGLAYKSETLGLYRWKFPHFVNNFCKRFLLPLLESSSRSIQRSPIPIPNTNRTIPTFSNTFPQTNNISSQGYTDQLVPTHPIMNPQVFGTPQPPSDESIDLLINMGFQRQDVVEALIRSNNNVEMATHILLDQN